MIFVIKLFITSLVLNAILQVLIDVFDSNEDCTRIQKMNRYFIKFNIVFACFTMAASIIYTMFFWV